MTSEALLSSRSRCLASSVLDSPHLIFSDSVPMAKKSQVKRSHGNTYLRKIGLVAALAAACVASHFYATSAPTSEVSPPLSYHTGKVLRNWEGDKDCFVQCFTRLNESHAIVACGGYGRSRVQLLSGFESNFIRSEPIFQGEKNLFFEGCAVAESSLLLLTWRERVVIEIDVPSFGEVRRVRYPRDGWGLTFDADRNILWSSDGSENLYQLDPSSLETKASCRVRLSHDGRTYEPVPYLNELEYVNGTIWANIYMDSSAIKESPNFLIGIDPISCYVTKIVPLFGLEPNRGSNAVFNGISAWDEGTLLVTGKNWKNVYQVSIGDTFAPSPSRFNITNFIRQKYSFR